jgi:hypothetical protein
MTLRRFASLCLVPGLAALGIVAAPALSGAQNRSNCTKLNGHPKLLTDCVEALFSQDPVHLTVSSLPPGNGLAVGIVAEEQRHYLTTFNPPLDSVFNPGAAKGQRTFEPQAKLGMVDARLALIGSTNLSWVTTGSLSWLPAAYGAGQRKDIHGIPHDCNKLGVLCTQAVLALHFEGTHQQLNTISFYGLGARSPSLKHTFPQNNTYGNAYASLPVFDWLVADGGMQLLKPVLSASSDPLAVPNTFTAAQLPGLASQPTYAHFHAGFSTRPIFDWNPRTNDADDNQTGPLMKKNLLFTLGNGMDYHWYTAIGQAQYSFQQFVFNGDETIQLGSNLRRLVYAHDAHGTMQTAFYHLLRHLCGETDSLAGFKDPVLLKVHDQCNYGRLDLRSSVTASQSGPNSAVPFYLQPTVGGSDINSQVSLRGFPDYRFRDRNATFSQVEYSVPVRDPVGLLLFYDAGTVGPTFGSLSFAHLRQDGGLGATIRVQGNVVAQMYLAWGAGHGPTLGYNLTKLF